MSVSPASNNGQNETTPLLAWVPKIDFSSTAAHSGLHRDAIMFSVLERAQNDRISKLPNLTSSPQKSKIECPNIPQHLEHTLAKSGQISNIPNIEMPNPNMFGFAPPPNTIMFFRFRYSILNTSYEREVFYSAIKITYYMHFQPQSS